MKQYSAWEPELIHREEIEGAFSFEEGFSRPDWKVISKVIDEGAADAHDLEAVWTEAARQWLMRLRSNLGGDYRVVGSSRFLLLTELNQQTNNEVLDFAERTLDQIRDRLRDAAWNSAGGCHVILLFSEEDDYYQYVSYFHRDGTHPTSGGCLLCRDYVHIAAPYDPSALRQTLAHELAHNCVVHLQLPLWLNEGLAVTFQRSVSTMPQPVLDHDLRERHLAWWNSDNIQEFWAGSSFHTPGESNELSYSLAEILLNLLLAQPGDWSAFVKQALYADAGQTAAIECYGTGLEAVVSSFLGEGDWRPRRKAMVTLWEAEGTE